MADAKYEVGQVVAVIGITSIRYLKGGQAAIVGFGAMHKAPALARDGLVWLAELGDIRPLAPGELPTIDSRGFPIEPRPENPYLPDTRAHAAWEKGLYAIADWAHNLEKTPCHCSKAHDGRCESSRADTPNYRGNGFDPGKPPLTIPVAELGLSLFALARDIPDRPITITIGAPA